MDIVSGRAFSAERRPIRHLDPVLLVATFGLSIVGILMVYSATHQSLAAQHLDPALYVKKQTTFLVLGAVVVMLAATFDYRFAKVYAGLIYVGMLFLLLAVRTPLGTAVQGSQRWFQFFGFQVTPSEYMKVSLILMLAAFLSELRGQERTPEDVFRATATAALPMALVFIQPDIGTTMVLAAVLVGVLVVAGARMRHLGILALTAVLLIFGAFQLHIVKDYQIQRLISFADPTADLSASGYNRAQAEIAIGAGGLTGRGYLQGTQTNLDFVPEQHTDFIFTVVGEEFGFVGSMLLLLFFSILLWRAFRIAMLSRDPFGTYVAAGVASMFAIQVFVNIGMTLGIMPITGIPLPFVSYGGSSLLANCACVGMLLNVHMRRFN
jgi:rod shape determining protein RodA